MENSLGLKKVKIKYVLLILVSVICLCTACSSDKNLENKENIQNDLQTQNDPESITGKKLSIVTTIFPEYDWVRCVLGPERTNQVELTMLLDKGVDMHSYQPTIEDVIKISNCDLFVYVGGESDGWVKDVLPNKINPDMKVINLIELLGEKVKKEEIVEGMEECDEEDSEEEIEYDEHVWLSLRNADYFCEEIANALSILDPENAELYRSNYSCYSMQLQGLNAEYDVDLQDSKYDTLLFGDRFPFRYLVDDYDIPYYAAFPGCSAETEASFDTILFLAKKVDELKLPAILIIDGSDSRIAEAIRENTSTKDQKILVLDSMQAKTKDDKYTYFSIMSMNLKIILEALGVQ